MTGKVAVLILCGLGLLLISCSVGPQYAKPNVPSAPAYSETPPALFEQSGGWKTAQPSDALLKGKWWAIFNDAELSSYEEQVETANLSLKMAEANYQQARSSIRLQQSLSISDGQRRTYHQWKSHLRVQSNGRSRFAIWCFQLAN